MQVLISAMSSQKHCLLLFSIPYVRGRLIQTSHENDVGTDVRSFYLLNPKARTISEVTPGTTPTNGRRMEFLSTILSQSFLHSDILHFSHEHGKLNKKQGMNMLRIKKHGDFFNNFFRTHYPFVKNAHMEFISNL